MRSVSMAIVLCAALGSAHAAEISLTSIEATNASNSERYDGTSKKHENLLKDLAFTSFRTHQKSSKTVAPASEGEFELGFDYVAIVTPGAPAEDGRVKANVRIFGTSQRTGERVKVVETNVVLAKEKPILFRGLRLEDGELLVILELTH